MGTRGSRSRISRITRWSFCSDIGPLVTLVIGLPGSRIRLEDREGVPFRILTHRKPRHAGQSNLAHYCLPAALLYDLGTRIDGRHFDSDANGLAGVFALCEPTVDSI